MAITASDRDLARALDVALEDLLRFDPVRSTLLGQVAHDGAFSDFSESGRRACRRTLSGHVHLLENQPATDPEVELDRRLLLDELQEILRTQEDLAPARRDPARYVSEVLGGIHLLLCRPPLQEHLGALLGRLRQVSRVCGQAREELDPADVPPLWAETAIATARAGLIFLTEGVPAAVQEAIGEGPLSAAVAATAGEAALSLSAYANFVEEHVLPAAAGEFAAGDSYFTFLLHKKHGVLQGLDDLLDLAREEIVRLEAELAASAARLRPDAPSYKEVLRALSLDPEGALPLGEGVVAECQELLARARRATAAAICPLPLPPEGSTGAEGERLVVQVTPAFARPLHPFSLYLPPQVLRHEVEQGEAALTGVLLLTPGLPRHRADLLRTCLHEGYPGRHLQHCHAARAGSRVRRVLGTSVYRDGWAGYAEGLLPDLLGEVGAFYALRAQLLMAQRVLVDIGLHCRGMSPEDAAALLASGAGLPQQQAQAEVRRYASTPTEALAGFLGQLGFRRLRREAEQRGGFEVEAFHQAVLRRGAVPLGYLHERI
jgi:hypothetical protein